MSDSETPAAGSDDPELYETERWEHFSYAIPVTPGEYTLTLNFIEHGLREAGLANTPYEKDKTRSGRIFDVFCNGKAIVRHLNIAEEAGNYRPVIRKIKGAGTKRPSQAPARLCSHQPLRNRQRHRSGSRVARLQL